MDYFVSYMNKVLRGENLYTKLANQLIGNSYNYNPRNLSELNVREEVKLHFDNWYLNLKQTAES